jgi:hypothetical protein
VRALLYRVTPEGKDQIIGEVYGTFTQIAEWYETHAHRRRETVVPAWDGYPVRVGEEL